MQFWKAYEEGLLRPKGSIHAGVRTRLSVSQSVAIIPGAAARSSSPQQYSRARRTWRTTSPQDSSLSTVGRSTTLPSESLASSSRSASASARLTSSDRSTSRSSSHSFPLERFTHAGRFSPRAIRVDIDILDPRCAPAQTVSPAKVALTTEPRNPSAWLLAVSLPG